MNAAQNYTSYNGDSNSFECAFTAIKARYRERGSLGSARITVAEQERSELLTRLENPGAYVFGQIMEKDRTNKYRSGVTENGYVMTVDDYMRLRSDEGHRRADARTCVLARMEKERADREISLERRPAHAYSMEETREKNFRSGTDTAFSGRREMVYMGGSCTEMQVSHPGLTLREKLDAFIEKYFPSDRIAKVGNSVRRNNRPMTAVALAVVFALVLVLPITLNVLITNTSSELSEMDTLIRAKDAEAAELRVELENKNDLFVIERLAVEEYGMIRFDESNSTVLRLNGLDTIESFSTEKSNNGAMLALLSALGIRTGNE